MFKCIIENGFLTQEPDREWINIYTYVQCFPLVISKTFSKSLVMSWFGFSFQIFFCSSVEVHCSLPVLYWWLVLSDFGSYSRCFLLKAESLTPSCHYIYSIHSEYDCVYEFVFHCKVPTSQTASWHSVNSFSRLTAMSKKNKKHRKGGYWVGTWVWLFTEPCEVAMSLPQESYLEFNIFRE